MTQEYTPQTGDLIEVRLTKASGPALGVITEVNRSWSAWDSKLIVSSVKIEWLQKEITGSSFSHWNWLADWRRDVTLVQRPAHGGEA